ncbi:endoribonuclease L-PSP [Aureococcus anophagefferens]|uniref:Endoribonuclease L-PSP n=1 Tax=Aureococcus anophagefferens TaxID=44056 RepID=A0ABR1G297_AURAN
MFSVSRRVARATAFILLQNRALAITRLGTKDPRMSQIVMHGDTVYLSGQVPADFEAPLADQVSSTLAKVDALLDEAGTDKSKRAAASRARVAPPRLDRLDAAPPRRLLSATIYVKSMDHFAEMNGIWNDWIDSENKPARACVEAPMARPGILFEVVCVAAK